VPWAYPPAYDSLVSARADTGAGAVLDRGLLLALIWQESKFDAAARSRSNAIGLMQLKIGVARALARQAGDRTAPRESALLDPAVNIRYGTRLLADLRRTFEGQVSLILAAYNAGPASAARWRRPEILGGEALEAELFEYAETQDYVKSILAARQAYRELAPRAGAAKAAPPAGP
jgi:soluble lytic murein transglycosylase